MRRNFDLQTISTSLLNKGPRISAIRPQLFETGKTPDQFGKQPGSYRAIVILGLADKRFEDQAFGIHNQMALATFDLFTPIVASYAPFSVVLTDWLSMLPALGVASRPSFCRSCSRSASFSRAHVPSLRHVLK
jgi:hypothetical protein